MSPDDRERLATEQAALVLALCRRGPAPSGWPEQLIESAAMSLRMKRVRGIDKSFPELRACLGRNFDGLLDEFRAQFTPASEGPAADADAFACWLQKRGLLSDDAKLAQARRRVRRGVPIRLLFLPKSRRVAVCVRLLGKDYAWRVI